MELDGDSIGADGQLHTIPPGCAPDRPLVTVCRPCVLDHLPLSLISNRCNLRVPLRSGDKRCRLDMESLDEKTDGACHLMQSLVRVVGVHAGRGGHVLMVGLKPCLEAAPRDVHGTVEYPGALGQRRRVHRKGARPNGRAPERE